MRLCRYTRNGKIKVIACRKGFSAREENLRGSSVHSSGHITEFLPSLQLQLPSRDAGNTSSPHSYKEAGSSYK